MKNLRQLVRKLELNQPSVKPPSGGESLDLHIREVVLNVPNNTLTSIHSSFIMVVHFKKSLTSANERMVVPMIHI